MISEVALKRTPFKTYCSCVSWHCLCTAANTDSISYVHPQTVNICNGAGTYNSHIPIQIWMHTLIPHTPVM